MADLVAIVAAVGNVAAVASAAAAAVTLRRAGNNFREQSRPIVVVELRKHEFTKGLQEIVIINYGHTPARDVTVTFEPEIKDPNPDSELVTTMTSALVRRLSRTISVLAPHVPIRQLYYATEGAPGGKGIMEGVPAYAVATVRYTGTDGTPYDDDFELDVRLVGLSSLVTGDDTPDARQRTIAESLAAIAKTLAARPRSDG
jgi:hypothetical protein